MSQPSLQEWLDRKPAGRKPKKPLPRSKPERRRQWVDYGKQRKEHLWAHPLCQLTIAKHRLDEKEVLAQLEVERQTGQGDVLWGMAVMQQGSQAGFHFKGVVIPWADQIHHRNKCDGVRLADARWFASAGSWMHGWVENHKDQARSEGYLLPFEADANGRLPDGSQCLTTDEWLATRARKRN